MAIVAGIIGVAGTAYAASQAGDAADAQADAARNAAGLTERQFDQTRSDLQGYRTVGDQALGVISRTLGLGGEDPDFSEFYNDPGYQFRLEQGNQALDRSAAANGMLLSGAQIKAAQRYNQGFASQEFGNWFGRLQGLAGMGQNAAVQTGTFGANAAANMGQYGLAAGNATAGGINDQTNLILQGLDQLGTAYGRYSGGSGSGYGDADLWAGNQSTTGSNYGGFS